MGITPIEWVSGAPVTSIPRDCRLLEALPLPAAWVGLDGLILGANQAYRIMRQAVASVAVGPGQPGGSLLAEAGSPAEAQALAAALDALRAGFSVPAQVLGPLGRGGPYDYCELTVGRVASDALAPAGGLVLWRDVTRRVVHRRRRRALAAVRDAIGRMRSSAEVADVLVAVAEHLAAFGVGFDQGWVHVVDDPAMPATVTRYAVGTEAAPDPDTQVWQADSPFARRWRQGVPVYHRDLAADDPGGEWAALAADSPPVRAVVCVPFRQGTLSACSVSPDAFGRTDLALLRTTAAVLSEAFDRWSDLSRVERHAARLRAETEQLQVNQATLVAALESMADAVFICDTQGTIRHLNQAFATFHRFADRAACVTQIRDYPALLDVLTPAGEWVPPTARVVARALSGQSATQAEYLLQRRDTGERWLGSFSYAPIRDAQGTIVGAVVTGRDITDRRRLEDELVRQRLLAAHTDRLRALGEMASAVAHELNQPLNGIRAYAEGTLIGLRRGWEMDRISLAEAMAEIVGQVERAAGVIDHMRAFSRTEESPKGRPYDPNVCVANALKLFGAQLGARGITMREELAASLPPCFGSGHEIEQVIINLLTNARDALDERRQQRSRAADAALPPWQPTITLTTQVDGFAVRLTVADNGLGVAPGLLDRVFEPFFTTKEVGRGTGIGLAIVRSLLDKHGGQIEVQNHPGQGVAFTLSLPFFHDPADDGTPQSYLPGVNRSPDSG